LIAIREQQPGEADCQDSGRECLLALTPYEC